MRALFFSDIDGTIADFNSYSVDNSLRGILKLQENMIPLIAVSSKTYDEMLPILRGLGLNYPFSFENGCGLAFPRIDGGFDIRIFGAGSGDMEAIIPVIENLTGKGIRPITSFTDDDLMDFTGLDREGASLAKKRKATLPFVADSYSMLTDEEINALGVTLDRYNVTIICGGRFNHILPSGYDKGFAVKKIIEFYNEKYKGEFLTAGAGDSPNDIPMLESVDFPYLIRKPGGEAVIFKEGLIMNSYGPEGFSEAVENFLEKVQV